MSYPETQNTKYGIAKIHNTGYYRITSRKEGNNGKLLHRLIFEDVHKRKLSLAKNTTGYYRVSKVRDDHYKQGFRYVYQYYKDGKSHYIKSVDLNVLEERVKEKGLVWEGLQ